MFVLSILLAILGVVTTITILSVIGFGIALSIALMKTKTLAGCFYPYNKRSRNLGEMTSILAITIVGFYVWGQFLRYGDYDLCISN